MSMSCVSDNHFVISVKVICKVVEINQKLIMWLPKVCHVVKILLYWKKVLITGGASGIGRQLVQRFYDDEAIVFVIDKNPESIKKLKEELPSKNVNAEICDISNWEETEKVVEGFGAIDHLVNCAGISGQLPFLELTEEFLSKLYKVNVFGLVNVSKVVAKGLISAGKSGTIVNISSTGARFGTNGFSVYASTKAAVENLTKSMAIEMGPHNIRVNCILPGVVKTPIYDNLDPDLAASFTQRNIEKRMVQPDEVVDLVMFLLSPLSTMIIGEGVVIDGGYLVS